MRKTKIVCTLGPACDDPAVLRQMMQAGMNVARFNFSHGTHEEQQQRFDRFDAVRQELGLPVAALLDTKGPEIRLKTFAGGKVQLEKGQLFTLRVTDEPGDQTGCGVSYEQLYRDVKEGSTILLDDGLIAMTVEQIQGTDIVCRVHNGGPVSDRKGVNLPGVRFSMPYLSPRDEQDILFAIRNDYDFIAASFVRRADDVAQIRRLLRKNGSDIEIIAKIENAEGVENIDEILAAADGVMVARGDMGVEIPFEKLPSIQKMMIKKANNLGKIVITATQMLDSMIKNPRPTRAEVSDVANAVYDGTGAIMLSGETAAGQYPVAAVEAMAAIAETTEETIDYNQRLREEAPGPVPNVTSSISYATCTTASSLGCAAIIPVSKTGRTARMISRFRPEVPIVCCTNSVKSQRRLSLVWGVYPLVTDEADSTDALFSGALEAALQSGLIQHGDMVVRPAPGRLGHHEPAQSGSGGRPDRLRHRGDETVRHRAGGHLPNSGRSAEKHSLRRHPGHAVYHQRNDARHPPLRRSGHRARGDGFPCRHSGPCPGSARRSGRRQRLRPAQTGGLRHPGRRFGHHLPGQRNTAITQQTRRGTPCGSAIYIQSWSGGKWRRIPPTVFSIHHPASGVQSFFSMDASPFIVILHQSARRRRCLCCDLIPSWTPYLISSAWWALFAKWCNKG